MMRKTLTGRFPSRKLAIALAVALAPQALPTLAQDEQASATALEEVVVTGTKRDVQQQDLPIAVSTITAAQLAKTFQNDVTELAQLSPNVTLTPQNGFNAIGGGMRGTGFISILVTKDPSVGLTVDDYAFNHVQSQFVEIFDIEQVEIFRGPQGTLYGKNTNAGAISDNNAGLGVEGTRQVRDGGRRHGAEHTHINAGSHQAGFQRRFKHVTGNARVLADYELAATLLGKHLAGGPAQLQHKLGVDGARAHPAADAVRSKILSSH